MRYATPQKSPQALPPFVANANWMLLVIIVSVSTGCRPPYVIFPYFHASSYMAMMFSIGVLTCRLWHEARM